MAGKKRGLKSFKSIFNLIWLVATVFCLYYIIGDIRADKSSAMELQSKQISEVKSSVSKLEKSLKSLSNKVDTANRKSTQLERAIAQIKKEDNSGIKWIAGPKRGKYALTPYPMPWHLAQKWARQNDATLVIVNDKSENDWLVKTFGGDTEYWLGITDDSSEGQWFTVLKAPVIYFNWLKGEPDNYKKAQHYGAMNCKSPSKGITDSGLWNDVAANDPRIGIVEKR